MKIRILLYERYVDDISMCVDSVEPGTKYDGEKLICSAQVVVTMGVKKPRDVITFEVIKQIGDSIHSSIILETDVPSNHID